MTTERVHYRERQLLRTADLETEQAYLIDLRRRHNVGPHDWGIVEGLQIGANPLEVRPGFAIDGYGRELVVPESIAIPSKAEIAKSLGLDSVDGKALDIWLLYLLTPQQISVAGRYDCGTGREGRWREEVSLGVTLVNVQGGLPFDPRHPPGTPPPTLPPAAPAPPGPHIAPPDDPQIQWPVYLGRIEPKNGPSDANRPPVLLRGQAVAAASGRARMQVDGELAGDRVRFGVFTSDETGKLLPRWTIDHRGNTTIAGDAHFGAEKIPSMKAGSFADMRIGPERAPVEPAPLTPSGLVVGPLPAPTAVASPWQIYLVPEVKNPPGPASPAELRFEFAAPVGKGKDPQFGLTVGHRKKAPDASEWSSCLQITDDCAVVVAGDLHVDGAISVGPIDANPFDPRFQEALLQYWLKGLLASDAAANGELVTTVKQDATLVEPGTTVTVAGSVQNVNQDTNNHLDNVTVYCTIDDGQSDPSRFRPPLGTIKGMQSANFSHQFLIPTSTAAGDLNLKVDVTGQGITGKTIRASTKNRTVHVYNNQLTAIIEMTPPVKKGAPLAYDVKVTNGNAFDLTGLVVTISIDDDGNPSSPTVSSFDVPHSGFKTVTGPAYTVQGNVGRKVTINATVNGPGPGSSAGASGPPFKAVVAEPVSAMIKA